MAVKNRFTAFLASGSSLLLCLALLPALTGHAASKDYLNDFDCWYDVPFTQGSASCGSAQCDWMLKTVTDTSTHTVYFYCDFVEFGYTSAPQSYDISLELSNQNAVYPPVFVRTPAAYDAFTISSNFPQTLSGGSAVCTFSVHFANSRDYNVLNAVRLVLYVGQNQYMIYETDKLVLSQPLQSELDASATASPAASSGGAGAAPSSGSKTTSASGSGTASTKFHADINGSMTTAAATKFSAASTSSFSQSGEPAGGMQTAQSGETARTTAADVSGLPVTAKVMIGIAAVLLLAGAAFVVKGLFTSKAAQPSVGPPENAAAPPQNDLSGVSEDPEDAENTKKK